MEARAQPSRAKCAFPEQRVSDRQVCSAEIKSWRVTTGSRTELHCQRHMESLMNRRPHLRPPTLRERKLKGDREL